MSSKNDRIASYKKTKEIIEANDFFLKKNYGQNFLIDDHVLNKIVNAAAVHPDGLVIEIGPGIGALTEALAEKAGKVIAVEIDDKLIPILKQTLAHCPNVEIVHGDILKTDILGLITGAGYQEACVAANLPYYITTPVLMDLLEKRYPVNTITVMVQKEVGNRIMAPPGTKDHGAVSLAVAYYADASLVANVPRNSFIPRPSVDSAVIRLDVREPLVQVMDEAFFFRLIKAAFSMRRKTLVNCLFQMEELNLSKEALAGILRDCGFSETIRGEALTLFDFAVLESRIKEALMT